MSNVFGTRQNNDGNNRRSVNTKSYQFKNKEGFEPSTLQIGSWDDMFSIRINPTLPKDKQSKEQIFDYDKYISTSLNKEKALLLLYKINKDIIPAMENDEEKNVGISVGGNNLVVVGTGKAITNTIKPYLAIFTSLDPDTKKPEQSIYYEFKKSMSIDDYDANTGTYTVENDHNSEFKLFCELLKSFIQAANFEAHNVKYNNRFVIDKLISTVNAIANKVGADTRYSSNYNNSYKRNNVFAINGSYNNNNNYESENTPMEELGDLNELMNE